MVKVPFILLSMMLWSEPGLAQIPALTKLFGDKQPKATWDCPQINYPEIKQLRSRAEVKINVQGDEIPRIDLRPSIFKVNPFSLEFAQNMVKKPVRVTLDYSACLSQFRQSVEKTIEERKRAECAEATTSSICKFSTKDIVAALDHAIESAEFFQDAKKQLKIPRILPGIEGGFPPSVIQGELAKLRAKEPFDVTVMLSREGMDYLGQNHIDLKKGEIEKLTAQFKGFQEQLIQDVCPISLTLCERMNHKLLLATRELKELSQKKYHALEEKDREWLLRLGIPDSEGEATKLIQEKIEATPFECNFMFKTFLGGDNREYVASKFPGALAANLDRLADVADEQCLDQMLQNYAIVLEYAGERGKEFKDYCQDQQSPTCEKAKQRLEVMERNFKRLFSMRYGHTAERYVDEQGECFLQPRGEEQTIISILEGHRKALTCVGLKEGESRVVSWKEGAPTGLSGNYLLKKTGPKTHDVLVGIDVPAGGFGVTKEEMQQRIQSCIKDVTPYLKGPGGEQLQLSIVSPQDTARMPINQRPPMNRVSIQSAGGRSHSSSYEADIDCPTITHEVLHLLGLCDEYNGVMDGYNCRAVAQVSSIMGNHYGAFENSVDKTYECHCYSDSTCERVKNSTDDQLKRIYLQPSFYGLTDFERRNKHCRYTSLPNANWEALRPENKLELVGQAENELRIKQVSFAGKWPQLEQTLFTCNCAPEDKDCGEFLGQLTQLTQDIQNRPLNSCPDGSVSRKSEYGNLLPEGRRHQWTPDGIKIVAPAKAPSLLHPNHFDRITGGACDQAAKKYNDCAKWAYRNKKDTNNCEGRPAYCENGLEFLGAKQ